MPALLQQPVPLGEAERATWRTWLALVRPRTLTASVMPVLAGLALASRVQALDLPIALLTVATALLIQMAVDVANDYFDFKSGVDKEDRLGPPRATGRALPVKRVKAALLGLVSLSALAGLGLALAGGWPILAIGLAALLSALLYAGGPKPLGHLGLGELFVFAFFGPVATAGTFFLQAHTWPIEAWLAGVPLGALSAAILLVNNVRDIATDARAGKRTLATRLGARGSWTLYAAMLALAYAAQLALWTLLPRPGVLLPLLSLPLALVVLRACLRSEGGPALNPLLVRTAMVHALFGLLLAGGLLL